MDSETHSDFVNLLYRLLSFKYELKVIEIEILIWKIYNKLTDKQISKLNRIPHNEINQIYLDSINKLRKG